MPFLVHGSFTSLVTMEEERELETDFKVKGKFKTENYLNSHCAKEL